MKKIILFSYLFVITSFMLQAKQIFVSPTGDNSNDGSMENPLWSVQKAQELATTGDTVYIRGGEYIITESDISQVENSLFACVTFLDKSGTENNTIKYWAYPGEQPVFDFSAVKPADQRVVGFWVEGNYIHIKGLEITGVQVTITTHTESYCIYSWGSYNTFENISMHDNKCTGLRHRTGGYNLFLNCDAYNNHDDVSEDKLGSNCDGFGCHPKSGGKGNIFKGCRAWFNSDDGYDLIRAYEAVVFDSCWSFYNGYSQSFESLGDGTGFKAGGYAYDEESDIPSPVPSNTIRFCIAVRNKANGFYSNHHLTGNTWLHNTAYKNSYNYNMVNRESAQSDDINVTGYDHILKNNLSYKGRSGETTYLSAEGNELVTNTFNMDITFSDDDFSSVDESGLMAARKEDGSLPDIEFMQIAQTSPVMDTGTDIGFPFSGAAPEPGAFEQPLPKIETGIATLKNSDLHIFPNPASNSFMVRLKAGEKKYSISLLNQLGQIVKSLTIVGNQQTIDINDLKPGVYFVKVSSVIETQVLQLVKK